MGHGELTKGSGHELPIGRSTSPAEQAAMVAALKSGRLAGAGLDVTDPEPIARRDPLLRLDNVVITPHIGSASIAARASMAAIAVDNILDVFAGRLPRRCANMPVKLRP